MAQLVQRYLDRIVEEHRDVSDGALANYIPELTRVDPNGIGLALSSADGFVYECGDAGVEFTIQSISKPFTYALALDRIGQDVVDGRIGVEPPERPSTRSAWTRRPRSRRTPWSMPVPSRRCR